MSKKAPRLQTPISELIDRLTIDQIREVMAPKDRAFFAREMRDIMREIDALIGKKRVKLTARLIRLVTVLAQTNLHIWHAKTAMMRSPSRYNRSMKLAHQLNGIRNSVKNMLLEEFGPAPARLKRTNTSTDGLKGWRVSVR